MVANFPGWKWYVTITSNKLFTRKQEDYDLYNENNFFSNPIDTKNPDKLNIQLDNKESTNLSNFD